jgi:iron complex transport system substrate-binding protein
MKIYKILILLFSLPFTIFCNPIELKDELGRRVKVPEKVERVISLQPEITRIIVSLGCGEKLVGNDYFMSKFDHIFYNVFPFGKKLPLVSISGSDLNLEFIIKLEPDIVFISPTDSWMADKIEKYSNIPVLALSSMGSFEKLKEEIKLISILTKKTQRAEELIFYFESKIRFIEERISKERKKPKVYLSFWSSFTKTPVYYEPVNLAGGINVAEGLLPSYKGTVGTVVNLEKIIKWNPDIILIHGNYPPEERAITVEKVLSDRRLSSIEAIRKRKVYYTFGFWFWWDPAEVLFETLYLSKIFHPSRFSQINLVKEGREIFSKFYHSENAFEILFKRLRCNEWKIE